MLLASCLTYNLPIFLLNTQSTIINLVTVSYNSDKVTIKKAVLITGVGDIQAPVLINTTDPIVKFI